MVAQDNIYCLPKTAGFMTLKLDIDFFFAANDMREQYKFGHTIDKDIANHYKVNAGSVVVFNAERFYTKHEPKWHILELKVGLLSISVFSRVFNTILSVAMVSRICTVTPCILRRMNRI